VRALVVESATEGSTATLVHAVLDDHGWDVTVAIDRETALHAWGGGRVDLVVVDLGMSTPASVEIVSDLRKHQPDLSILILVAGPGPSQGIAALSAGADDFLAKPFSRQELSARLGAAARRRTRGTRARTRLQEVITGVTTDVADAVVVTSADQRILSFNPAAEELYGFSADEVLQLPASTVLRWAGSESVLATARAQISGDGSWHGVADQFHRDGSLLRVRSSTQMLRDDDGTELGMISVNRPFRPEASRGQRRAAGVIKTEIRGGLEADAFIAHYQPIFRIEDRSIVGVEALARWQHGDELRLPVDFIDVAEQSDLIVEIGRVVLNRACQQLQEWARAGHAMHLSVNIAARQLLHPSLVDDLESILTSSGISSCCLTLEVTETALIQDIAKARKVLLRIADLGIGVSIDDFGTGWASLTYLQQLPVTCLKIDQSFVAGLGVGRRATAIARSILALGRELDLVVIAEGIETEAQLEHLHLLGCRIGQGHIVAPALPPEAVQFEDIVPSAAPAPAPHP
jgi:PAS domain S-box-containing protein